MISNEVLLEKINSYHDYMVQVRRHLHQYPELSGQEKETVAYLKKEINQLGLPIVDVPNSTGFYVVLDTGRPGKTVGVRTDIDALPIEESENNLKGKRSCISQVPGVMHACGHDGHMATTLAAVFLLNALKEQFDGKVIFIFEEGEEISSGIEPMIEALKPLQLDTVYGTHLTSFMESGTVCIDGGPRMAGYITIEFDVVGKGGHGSRPDLSINPIFGGVSVLSAITSAWANQLDVSKTVTLGITRFNAGNTNNVFPDSAFISGSLRYFDDDEGKRALKVFKEVATLAAKSQRCEAVFKDTTKILNQPVINDDYLAKIARDGAKELYGDKVLEGIVWYASESFSHYSKLAPSVFAFVGVGNPEVGSGAEHHNNQFDLDEAALTTSLGSTVKFVLNMLTKQ